MAALAHHYDDLVDYIKRRFNGRDFARDLIHDVCVQMIEKPPRESIATPLAFLRKAAFNRAIDRIRAERTRQLHLQGYVPEYAQVDPWDGAHALDFEQQLEALLDIIEALPARQRQVFLLNRVHEMRYKEIADGLGISVNMVTVHYARAMKTIAQHWEPARLACNASTGRTA
ncbi:RNA polymerase sigma factor [Pseudomonas fontis]|uniref:RNA polymerase sigma factor n=1 Tax=Pseudomonas fontis TaxID=2942633 RepID=A0ABT5NYE6_9PSED|nr:RNA polymerase sigma factor [Pseudomonas fontis]MDD0976786.1 RNA polymerase sigma factor [Pseudomonas fontis]MDD0993215.1 RNA polymerase sigma factor [Pseudomonas fontis]